ncbi:hypothetical protein F5Y05DRAFT_424132 [Hypoxylon sp. FL0543]|nr:hypothetical protein F5Y05DRAFT_424132 [Hypoxylon sp. FL0543]
MGVITSLLATFGPGGALCAAHAALAFVWPHARPLVAGDDALTTRYMHATRGRPAWALVADAAGPVGRALCLELAARGFNVVLYGAWGAQQQRERLEGVRDELVRGFPENKYRIIVADGDGVGVAEFTERVVRSLTDVNLTLVVDGFGGAWKDCGAEGADAALPGELMAALVPLLRRNAPALVLNVAASPPATTGAAKTPLRFCYGATQALSQDGVDVDLVSCCLGEVSTGGRDAVSLTRPTPRALARAVLAHAGYSWSKGGGAVVYPYLPDDLLQVMRDTLPGWAVDRILDLVGGKLGGWGMVTQGMQMRKS